jgi:hypothetical protein
MAVHKRIDAVNAGSVTLDSTDVALAIDLIQYAIEEIAHTIEMAEQRRHIPHGLKDYRLSAVALITRLRAAR